MANEIKIDLNLTGEQATARGLKNVGDAADQAGDDLSGMAKDAGFLEKRIGDLRGEYRGLIKEFDQTGDVDILKKLKGSKRELGQLEGLKKQLAEFGKETGSLAGGELGEGMMKKAATASMAARPLLIGALVGVGVLAAPFLGGIISSAVIGGVGAGGIIGGVALAAQDSRVQAEATKLGGHLSAAFTRAAEPFVAPTVEALHMLRGVVDDVSSDMRQGFATLAPVLVPLTKGLSGLVTEAMPGVLDAFKAAKPVLIAIGNELPKIGRAIGEFLSTISEDPRGAIMAFQDLSRIIQGTIIVTGEFLALLSKGWAKLSPIVQAASGDIDGAVISVFNMNAAMIDSERLTSDTADSVKGLGKSADQAAQEIADLTAAMDKAFGKTMDIQQATIDYEKSWDDTIEALRDGKRTLDATTEAGRENRGAILDNIQSVKDLRDANIANNMSVADADALYSRQIEQLRQSALKLGFNKQQVEELIGAFSNLPRDVELELRVKGLRGVIEQINALSQLLGSKAAASASLSGSYVSGRASGGPVYPGQTYVVGENGPEVLQMGSSGGQVYNTSQTKAMMAGGMAGAAPVVIGGTLRYVGPPGAAADIASVLMTMFRVEIAAQGGNVQTVLGGR